MPELLGYQFDRTFPSPIERYRRVATIAERDAIPTLKRWEGMECYVTGESQDYQLVGGITNLDWVNSGSGNYFDTTVNDSDDITEGVVNLFMDSTQDAKLAFITVTQAVDLDQMEIDIAALGSGVTFKGTWSPSGGVFPGGGTTAIGDLYIADDGGTIDSVTFASGDGIIATVVNASTTTFIGNWAKTESVSDVTSVVGLTGVISKSALLAALNVEDGATADMTGSEISSAITTFLTSADWQTKLTSEEVQDFVGAMINTQTNITVTYDDSAGVLNFVVADFIQVYATLAIMIADQVNQVDNRLYEVTDASGFTSVTSGTAWVRYLGTTVGDETDYVIVSKAEAGTGTIGGSITDNQVAVGATTANNIEGSSSVTWDGQDFDIIGGLSSGNASGEGYLFKYLGGAFAQQWTAAGDTSTAGELRVSSAAGGLLIRSLTDANANGLIFQSYMGTTGAITLPVFKFQALKDNGSNSVTDLAATDVFTQHYNNGTLLATLYGNGDYVMSTGILTLNNQVQWAKGADVASATALPILTDGNYFDVTGTTTVTSINTTGHVGTVIKLHFDAVLTLTHHATDLILPTGANITTAAGDEAEFIEYASGDFRCTNYSRADGTALVGGGSGTDVTTKGDLQTFSTVGDRLPVGTDGYALTPDSGEATGLKWTQATTGTGTAISLSLFGSFFNTATPSTATTYTTTGSAAVGAWAKARSSSSTASEPAVTGATQEGGVEWQSGAEFDIFIIRDDEGVKYSFIPTPTVNPTEVFIIACSDESTALTTGTAKVTFRMPFAGTLIGVRASLTGAGSTSGTTTVDINESGTSVLSTKLTIDFGEKTSETAATAAVISDSALADDAEITIDIDAVTTGAVETGLKVTLEVRRN